MFNSNQPPVRQNTPMGDADFDTLIGAIADLPIARRPAHEQFERLRHRIIECERAGKRRTSSGFAVAAQQYTTTGEVQIDDTFLHGMKSCACSLWTLVQKND